MRCKKKSPREEGSASRYMHILIKGREGSLLNKTTKNAVTMMIQHNRCILNGVNKGFFNVFLIR